MLKNKMGEIYLGISDTDGQLMCPYWPWNYFSKRNNKSIDHLTEILFLSKICFKKKRVCIRFMLKQIDIRWEHFFWETYMDIYRYRCAITYFHLFERNRSSSLSCILSSDMWILQNNFWYLWKRPDTVSLCAVHRTCTLAQVWVEATPELRVKH